MTKMEMEWIHSSSSCSNRPDLFPPIVSVCLDFSCLVLCTEFVSFGYSKVVSVTSRGLKLDLFSTLCPQKHLRRINACRM